MDLFKLRDTFDKEGIMICFNGPFSHSIIDEIGVAVRNHLTAQNLTLAAVLDVFAVFIELAQNVKNYYSVRKMTAEEAGSSIMTIARKGWLYTITSGNMLLKEDVAPLTAYIDMINGLDQAAIRKRYKEQLRKDIPASALGAGLGIMEMAKRSTEKMTYEVSDMGQGTAFFSFSVYITCKE